MSTDIGPKRTKDASYDKVDTNHKTELEAAIDRSNKIIHDKMTDIQIEASTDKKIRFGPKVLKVEIPMTEGVYKVARLICQFEYDLDWDHYLSELVRQDAFSILGGERNIFKDYAERVLEDEEEP